MAVTVTTLFNGVDSFVADVSASADADTTAVVTHGLVTQEANKPGRGGIAGPGVFPFLVIITPLLQAVCALSEWATTGITDVAVTCTKSTAVGSGDAQDQLRVFIAKPNSYGR